MDEQQQAAPKRDRPPRWQRAFLEHLRLTANVTRSALVARIDRGKVYDRRREDADFAAAWDDAKEQAADLLEEEAHRRAYHGVDEPVIHQGELMGAWVNDQGQVVATEAPGARKIPLTVKKYSDTLMIFLLKGARPEKYRENLKLTGNGENGEVLVKVMGPKTSLSDL
jgi:hypothetical protein